MAPNSLLLAQRLRDQFSDCLSAPTEFRGEISIVLANAERVVEVMQWAKNELKFDLLTDLSGVDQYGKDPRWLIVYELCGIEHGAHLRIKTSVAEEKSELPSVSSVWRTANWHEREVYDMLGIRFCGHPDLRRILMWEGYPYFPLRKDFPLAGKKTDLPDIAFTRSAPLEGGPFVTLPGGRDSAAREPRVRIPESS